MKESELLDSVREIELSLFSREFSKWVRMQSDEDKKTCRILRTEISTYRSQLETNRLQTFADKLDELTPSLEKGVEGLQREIEAMGDFVAVMETLGKVIGLVSRTVTLAA